MAEETTGGRKYNLAARERDKRELRRLVIEEGLTNRELSERLKLPDRTCRRYLYEVYREDSELLSRPSEEHFATEIAIFRDKVQQQARDCMKIATDSSIDPEVRILAHQQATEYNFSVLKLAYNSPTMVARYLRQSSPDLFLLGQLPDAPLMSRALPTTSSSIEEQEQEKKA